MRSPEAAIEEAIRSVRRLEARLKAGELSEAEFRARFNDIAVSTFKPRIDADIGGRTYVLNRPNRGLTVVRSRRPASGTAEPPPDPACPGSIDGGS